MWLCKYDYSLSTIKKGNDWSQGNAVNNHTEETKDGLIRYIRKYMMDTYSRPLIKEGEIEAGIQCSLKIRCSLTGDTYWYNLIDLNSLDVMDKTFYELEYEEYAELRDAYNKASCVERKAGI